MDSSSEEQAAQYIAFSFAGKLQPLEAEMLHVEQSAFMPYGGRVYS